MQKYVTRKVREMVVEDAVELPAGTAPVVVQVPDSRYALACVSAAWFGHPERKMTMIGVTGTNGKTTEEAVQRHSDPGGERRRSARHERLDSDRSD